MISIYIITFLAIFNLAYTKSIEEIPEVEKLILKGDNSHWCCAGVTPINVIQKTQLASDVHVVAYQVITGYRDCGFLGWSSCTVWGTQYKNVVTYYVQTVDTFDYTQCPATQIKCCNGYLYFPTFNNCIAMSTLTPDVIQTLSQLAINQGK